MIRLNRRGGLLAACLFLALDAGRSGASAQGSAPADLRAAVEGTWQLEEWHVDGQVLRPPQADGRWSKVAVASDRDRPVLVLRSADADRLA